jgi:hypothetical protein
MKFLFSFLSVLIIYLSCLPCSDSNDDGENLKIEEKVSATTDHNKHSHSKETCSPFCACSCCASSAVYYLLARTPTSKPIFQSEKYLVFNTAFNSEVYCSIWQPPKLAA